MKRCVLVLAAAALTLAAFADDKTPGRVEQAFSNHGRVNMELGGGSYEIRAGSGDKIVVVYTTQYPEQMNHVEVRFTGGRDATHLKVHGPRNNFRVTIEVPPQTDLRVRLAAGDMAIRGIEGNKDVESHAGDLRIDVGRAEDYGTIDASVHAGDLNAPAFRVNKGGLFRSFSQRGPGKYRLHAHLGAGDLTLR